MDSLFNCKIYLIHLHIDCQYNLYFCRFLSPLNSKLKKYYALVFFVLGPWNQRGLLAVLAVVLLWQRGDVSVFKRCYQFVFIIWWSVGFLGAITSLHLLVLFYNIEIKCNNFIILLFCANICYILDVQKTAYSETISRTCRAHF